MFPWIEKLTWRGEGLFVLHCLLLAAALRFWGLESRSLWGDEAATALRIDKASVSDLIEDTQHSPFPPLFYLLEYALHRHLDVSSLSLRLIPFAVGLLAVPATYLGTRILGGKPFAVWATLLTATNAFHIHYSQDAKMYSLVWLLVVCSNLAFLNLLFTSRSAWAWSLVYVLATALLPWVSYVGIVAHGVQGVWLVVLCSTSWRPLHQRILLLGTLLAAASLPFLLFWAPVAINASARRHGIDWIPPVATWTEALAGFWGTSGCFLVGLPTNPFPVSDGIVAAAGLWATFAAIGFLVYSQGVNYWSALSRRLLRKRAEGVMGVAGQGRLATPSFARGPGRRHSGDAVSGLPLPRPRLMTSLLLIWWAVPLIACMAFSVNIYSLWGIPRFLTGAACGLVLLIAWMLSVRPAAWKSAAGLLLIGANLLVTGWSHLSDVRMPINELVMLVDEQDLVMPAGEFADHPTLLVTKTPPCQVSEAALEVTLRQRHAHSRIVWIPWGSYRQMRGAPLLILHESDSRKDSMSARAHLSSIPGWKHLLHREVREHRLTAMPDPGSLRCLDAWSWSDPACLQDNDSNSP